MITCKICKHFAKFKFALINGAEEIKVFGSCKHCGYEDNPKLKDEDGKQIPFQQIPDGRIDYEDFEELGIEEKPP